MSWPWNALIKINQKKIPIYSNFDKTKVLCYIMNDTVKEDYLELRIIEKRKDMFKVKFASVRTEKKVRGGWIDLKYVGTYLRSRLPRDEYPIYDVPDKNTAYIKVINKSNEMVNVIDISGTWVRVKMTIKGKVIIGWVPKEYLCPDPYASCT